MIEDTGLNKPLKVINTPDIQANNEALTNELSSPEFDEIFSEPLSILELEEKLHIQEDPDGRKQLPLSPILLTAALQSENKVVFENRKNTYRTVKDYWNNLEEVDLGVTDENIRTYKHAQRVGYNVFRMFLAYQLLHDLRKDNPQARLDSETLKTTSFLLKNTKEL